MTSLFYEDNLPKLPSNGWTCVACGQPVAAFTITDALVDLRPTATQYDCWAACSNPMCQHTWGDGYWMNPPNFVNENTPAGPDLDSMFKGEYGEDRWVWTHVPDMRGIRQGTYLDLGCAHPIYNSNTAFLRELTKQGFSEWKGVGVDANPAWGKDWTTPFECCVVSNYPTVGFKVNQENFGISRVDDTAPQVSCRTVNSILEQHGIEKIDFLSIDLEGHEYEALLSLDLNKYRPSVVISEYNTMGLPMDFRVRLHLLKNGYNLAHSTGSNDVFRRL